MAIRSFLYAMAIALVLMAEWQSLHVPTLEGAAFGARAIELERTSTWRYGYVLRYHGAVLVRTRLGAGAPPLAPVDPTDAVASAMARVLRLAPWKAAFELSLYATLWAFWSAGIGRWRRRFGANGSSPWRRSVTLAALSAAFVTAVLAPYLVAGYGEPLFSTWNGPGAMSASMYFGSTTNAWSPALTYRGVVLGALMLPLVSLEWTYRFLAPIGIPTFYWLVSAVFYGVVAAAWECQPWEMPWIRGIGTERSTGDTSRT